MDYIKCDLDLKDAGYSKSEIEEMYLEEVKKDTAAIQSMEKDLVAVQQGIETI